jgi:hypothetical protein
MKIREIIQESNQETQDRANVFALLKQFFEYDPNSVMVEPDDQGHMAVTVHGSIYARGVMINSENSHSIPVKFRLVTEDFNLIGRSITSLQGCPSVVEGNFNCTRLGLEDLEGGPASVDGDYVISRCRIKSLKGMASKIGGDVFLRGNALTNLRGLPENMPMAYLGCEENPLTSLEGLPPGLGTIELSYDPELPLMRTLTAHSVKINAHGREYPQTTPVEQILNRHAGLGKRGMMKCASELLTLGAKLGLDLRANCRW